MKAEEFLSKHWIGGINGQNLEDVVEQYANQRVIEELEKFILYKQKLEQMFDSEQVVALAVIEELDKKYKELKQLDK